MSFIEIQNKILKTPFAKRGKYTDGSHSFSELYTMRKLYNAAIFNSWAKMGLYDVHKSRNHNDGELCFGGDWFIVCAITPVGTISNHYRTEDWELFNVPEEKTAKTIYNNEKTEDILINFINTQQMQPNKHPEKNLLDTYKNKANQKSTEEIKEKSSFDESGVPTNIKLVDLEKLPFQTNKNKQKCNEASEKEVKNFQSLNKIEQPKIVTAGQNPLFPDLGNDWDIESITNPSEYSNKKKNPQELKESILVFLSDLRIKIANLKNLFYYKFLPEKIHAFINKTEQLIDKIYDFLD